MSYLIEFEKDGRDGARIRSSKQSAIDLFHELVSEGCDVVEASDLNMFDCGLHMIYYKPIACKRRVRR